MKKINLLLVFGLLIFYTHAQAPSGYYNAAQGKTGFTLKTALKNIITNGHDAHSYGDLYTLYKTSDTDHYYENNNTVLDMYSENPNSTDDYEYTHVGDKCGTYHGEGGCYNREHIMPQSVFHSASPMKSDGHFVVPSDGYVNNRRSNHPFGIVNNPTWTSSNGSKLGDNSTPGYSDTVFEPIDEFKGDIARMLFYFATRYEDQVAGWSHDMLNGTSNQVYTDWFLKILLQWHQNDPVSQREIDRNNAVYDYQGNRNPFIDHPEWVNSIWGDDTGGGSGGGSGGGGGNDGTIAYQDFDGTSPAWTYRTYQGGYQTIEKTSNRSVSGKSLRIKGTNKHNSDPYIEFDNVDISDYSSVKLSVSFSAKGPDSNDDLYLDISYDNGNSWDGTGSVKLVDGYRNTNFDFGDTTGRTVDSNPYTIDIPDQKNQIMIRIRFDERGNKRNTSDYYYVDNIKLEGVSSTSNPTIPEITNIVQDPSSVTENDTVNVYADITDPDGIDTATLYWGLSSDNLNHSVTMSLDEETTYVSSIPAQAADETVYYKIYTVDNAQDDVNSDVYSYTVVAGSGGSSCAYESFKNLGNVSSYSNGSFEGDDGFIWYYYASRDERGYEIDGTGIMLRRSSDNSRIISESVSEGIGDFSCDLKKAFTGRGNRQVELFVNGISYGKSIAWDNTDVQEFKVNGINISGDVSIEIRNVRSKQVIVDNISWTCYAGRTNAQTKLNIPSNNIDTVSVYRSGENHIIRTNQKSKIKSLRIYDLSGRIIFKNHNINHNVYTLSLGKVLSGELLIFQIELNNQETVTKKVIR